jgi:uncharacterized protein YcbK (DUF882 family)
MSSVGIDSGHNSFLPQRFRRTLTAATVAAIFAASTFFGSYTPSYAFGETRTISLYHVHTKESLTITYKVNGRYIPSAMSKINHLMRDWRRNETIKMDPETVDLMWELHADLGSNRPIHIICGFRSPKTNAFLKRIGRNVARKSQHMVGKAIDLYFPDVPTVKIRNSALVRQVGGVGYYRSSGGPSGFVHIDSGKVRHWGPGISSSQMAQIMRDYKKTVGARLNRKDMVAVAAVEDKETEEPATNISSVYEGVDEDAEETAEAPVKPVVKPGVPKAKPVLEGQPELIAEATSEIVEGYPVPKPRPKPIEVLMMAAANMTIEPASAPAPRVNFAERTKPATDSLGVVAGAESLVEEPRNQETNVAAKGSFADELRDGTAENTPLIKPLAASASGEDLFWWPKQLMFSPDQAMRRDGAPQEFAVSAEPLNEAPKAVKTAPAEEPTAQGLSIASLLGPVSSTKGKADRLVVNRTTKGSLLMDSPVVLQKRQKLGQLQKLFSQE